MRRPLKYMALTGPYSTIGHRIRHIREIKNVTLEYVAAVLDVHSSTVQRWEKGFWSQNAGYRVLESIHEVFPDANIHWIMTGESTQFVTKNDQEVA